MVILFGLLVLAALAVFAVENWAPAVPLVIFGVQTTALPVALWVIGALLAGALTVLAVAVLLQLISRGVSSSRRPWDAARYADEEKVRQRYVADDKLDDPVNSSGEMPPGSQTGSGGRSRWSRPPNPYVDGYVDQAGERDESDDGDDYDDYGDYDDYDDGGGRNPGYRPSSGASVSSPPPRSPRQSSGGQDDWDSFSQPRRDWSDWGGDRRPNDSRPSEPPYRTSSRDVDAVLEVDPIDAARPRDRDDGDAAWNSWSGYEEPAPSDRTASFGSPEDYPDYFPQEHEPRRSYDDSYGSERYGGERYDREHYDRERYDSDRYGDTVEPDEFVVAEPHEPPYEPPYDNRVYSNRVYDSSGYGDSDRPADQDDSPDRSESEYEDYIIDYGDEAEIDQFDLAAARGRAAQPSPTAEPDLSGNADDGADDDDDWSDWDDDAPATTTADPNASPLRDIYEVPAKPKAVSRSGSIYTYSYRDIEAEDGPEDEPEHEPEHGPASEPKDPPQDNSAAAETATSPQGDEDDHSPGRTLIPPYQPDDTSPDSTP